MRTARVLVPALLVVFFAAGHDMFLKFGTHFLAPNKDVTVQLINGTFEKSENAIDRDRMTDVSIVGSDQVRIHPETSAWSDDGITTFLRFTTGDPGTYTVGVSTAPSIIELAADEFNEYLEHDGILDILNARRTQSRLGDDAVERYSKHVKAVFQVGDASDDGYGAVLGYPIEIVPLQNPFELSAGDDLDVRLLLHGEPLAGHLVYAGHEGQHEHDESGDHREAVQTRTDENGSARIPVDTEGRWYVRVIHMTPVDEESVTHESNWATLTFEIR